jgi:hypothetical protein
MEWLTTGRSKRSPLIRVIARYLDLLTVECFATETANGHDN